VTEATDDPYLLLLREHLTAANKVAQRFAWSFTRVARLMPLKPSTIEALTEEDEEKLDAFLLRFNSLTAIVQDHITKALLSVEEEDIKYLSRKDQRLLMEKLGALPPSLDFATIAELRNRIPHHYPDENAKQAEILNGVFKSALNLVEGYNSVLRYADHKVFQDSLDIHPVVLPGSTPSL
jgi:hypothetical protein